MNTFHPDILDRFRACLARDRAAGTIPDWMTGWLYKDQTDWVDFDGYRGPGELPGMLRWSSWKPPACYLAGDGFQRLLDASEAFDRQVLRRYGLEEDAAALRDTAVLNAMDYVFCNSYPTPAERRVRQLLDFGAGHGRQFNLWSQFGDLARYVAMDATALMYCVQHQYFHGSGAGVADYVLDGEAAVSAGSAVLQLPTWRHDLLADDSIDLVLAVEVLPELPVAMVPWVVALFARVLKPGGALYLRDQNMLISRNQVPVERLLEAAGFVLEFRPHLVNGVDLLGVPRVWRKLDPRAAATL